MKKLMTKLLSKPQTKLKTFYVVDGVHIDGVHSDIHGDVSYISGNVSDIHGDVSYISGNVSGIYGEVSSICGNLDDCKLTTEDRKKGICIEDLLA